VSLISAVDATTFQREGVVCLRGILPADWVARIAAGVEENLKAPGPYGKDHGDGGSAYFGDYVNWERITVFRDVADKGPLGAVAGALMGTRTARLFHEHVLVKEPGNGTATPWHQDQPYYAVDGNDTVSLWVPLDPVAEAVCPRFLAGSQADGKMYVPRRFKTGDALEGDTAHYTPFDGVDEIKEAARLRFWAMQPGDAIAFHFRTLHNAPPNLSATRRRVVSFRFVGDDARYATRPHAVSPPFPELGVTAKHGDAMPDDWFPVVWTRL
jgi:ectoine hydroxylase-related dioxygenase (phytanoyl-CoA dioxygenase family)